MARCLVSGANGFLGRALSRELQSRGHEVIPLKRDWTSVPEVDYIYHLGAYGNMHQQSDRAQIFRANVQRTFDLLEATKDMPYTKFVYISSSSVTLPTQTLYSASKKACEGLIQAYNKPMIIIRPYSITGVGEQKEHLIPTLIDAAFSGKEIPFVGGPRHDFFDISDFIIALMSTILDTRPTKVFYLGSGQSYSNQEVKEIVEKVTGKKIKVKIVESLRSYDTNNWVSPHEWPSKPLKQTIQEMVKVYEST